MLYMAVLQPLSSDNSSTYILNHTICNRAKYHEGFRCFFFMSIRLPSTSLFLGYTISRFHIWKTATTNNDRCSTGSYCPSGTAYATQYACDAGTYTDSTNLTSANQCRYLFAPVTKNSSFGLKRYLLTAAIGGVGQQADVHSNQTRLRQHKFCL